MAFSVPVQIVLGTLSSIVSICSIMGNLLVLFAFCVDPGVRIPNNYFIISLAVTDLTTGLLSLNLLVMYILLGYWPLGDFICDSWLAIDFTACLVSQVTVFLITLDRYLSVKYPVRYRNWRSDTKLKVMIALSWLGPFALWTPMVFAWYQITGDPRPPSDQCNIPFPTYTTFNTVLTVSYFWIPLTCIISLYVGIYRIAAGLNRKVRGNRCGLAELVLTTGNTMSKIGLSAHAPETKNRPEQREPLQAHKEVVEVSSTQEDQESLKKKDYREEENGATCNTGKCLNSKSMAPQMNSDHHTDYADSGLGESNNQRPAYDCETKKRRSSSMSMEVPEYSEEYQGIQSPRSPPSETSSVFSETDGPWTKKNEVRSIQNTAGREEVQRDRAIAPTATNFDHVPLPIKPAVEESHLPPQNDKTTKEPSGKLNYASRSKKVMSQSANSYSLSRTDDSSDDSEQNHARYQRENAKTSESGVEISSSEPFKRGNSFQDRFLRFANHKSLKRHKTDRRNRRRARKALRMISFILGAFVICWTPYHVTIIVKGFCDIPSEGYSCVNQHVFNFAYYMCYMNSPINPFCYALANVAFKRAFLRILHGDFLIK